MSTLPMGPGSFFYRRPKPSRVKKLRRQAALGFAGSLGLPTTYNPPATVAGLRMKLRPAFSFGRKVARMKRRKA